MAGACCKDKNEWSYASSPLIRLQSMDRNSMIVTLIRLPVAEAIYSSITVPTKFTIYGFKFCLVTMNNVIHKIFSGQIYLQKKASRM